MRNLFINLVNNRRTLNILTAVSAILSILFFVVAGLLASNESLIAYIFLALLTFIFLPALGMFIVLRNFNTENLKNSKLLFIFMSNFLFVADIFFAIALPIMLVLESFWQISFVYYYSLGTVISILAFIISDYFSLKVRKS